MERKKLYHGLLVILLLLLSTPSWGTESGKGRNKLPVDKMALIKEVNAIIKEKTKTWNARVVLKAISLPDYLEITQGEHLEIIIGGGNIQPGSNSILLRVLDGTRPIKSLGGSLFLDVWKKVPCAAVPLNRGDTLTPDKVTYVEKNLAYLPHNIWNGTGGPWRVKIPMGRLQVITLSHIEPMPTIQRNEKIKLIFNGKGVYLQVAALALRDGNKGDIIPVLNLMSKRVVYGRIIGRGTVSIQ